MLTCQYLGERGERVGPPAPPFSVAYSSTTTWWILFRFSTYEVAMGTGCIQSWKTWKSHGILVFISRPGKVMEIDSRFGKFIKGHRN